jgi:murein DD-endopeptidase MepM/ murein hydrolase activator NlpD
LIAVVALLLATAAATSAPVLSGSAEQGGLLHGTAPAGMRLLALGGKPVAVAPDGAFIIGFGRDAPAQAVLSWTIGDATTSYEITVTPRQWRIQSLPNLPPRPVPDAEFEARRPAELAKIAAARATISAENGWRSAFVAPVLGPITGVYGSQRILAGTPSAPHAGLDFGAKAGTPVLAPAAGIVRLAEGPFTLEGNLVMIDHGMGLVTAYLHLSRIDVKPGDQVATGQPIGLVGATGRATGPHLHWGATWTDVRIDPAPLLKKALPDGR